VKGAFLVAVVSACGGSYEVKELPPLLDATAFVNTTRDAAAIKRMLAVSVTNGGLWFDDPACAARFSTPGEIKPDGFAAFARCLAGLHLQASPRADELADVIVLTYEPGFEIEARVVNELGGARLTWIGYESRRREDPIIPTVTVATLESHRLAGEPNGPLDPEVAKTLEDGAATWLKVCVAASGAVTVEPRETTSVQAQRAFAEAASNWKFRPFMVRDRAIDICGMFRLAHPAGPPQGTETLPLPLPVRTTGRPAIALSQKGASARVVEGQRIAGERTIVPGDDARAQMRVMGVERVTGRFRVCIDETGHVETVLPVQSTRIAPYDRKLIYAMRSWVYRPYLIDGQPTAVCTSVTFIYSQDLRSSGPMRF